MPQVDSIDQAESVPVLGPQGAKAFQVHGAADKVKVEAVEVQEQPFSDAVRAEILESSNSEWTVQMQTPTTAAVSKGDALLATFYVRSIADQAFGAAETQFVFERAGAPYTKSVTYPVALTPQWRKVQVPFTSVEDYAAGEAQMIFRLGYDPQTIEVGGVEVANFGQQIAVSRLPSTEAADKALVVPPADAEPLAPVDSGEITIAVNTKEVIGKISPYVYGINSQTPADTHATVRRMGGNRQTVYNWELNASSAGHDWKHLNDDWPCTALGFENCDVPGAQFVNFVESNNADSIASIATIPMIDYASADKNGTVSETEAAPSPRFVRSYPKKAGPYVYPPDLKDGAVYQDEFVHYLVQKLGPAEKGGTKFYSLDNEPALWPTTHPRVHPERTTYAEVYRRTEALAAEITRIDPSAMILGGVMFGWSEFMSLSSAPDSDENNATYGTYVEYFLSAARGMEQRHGRRLVHVLDIHWYPEVKGTSRITKPESSLKTVLARLQAPRSLWDPNFREKSWITDSWEKPIELIPWMKSLIDRHYPGTKLSITEYNYGGENHISGALAQVDVLGIFGREGLFIGNYWGNGAGVGKLPRYIAPAFKLFRNYDGKGGKFGDTAVQVSVPDIEKATAYAATDSSKPGRVTIVVINKDQKAQFRGKVQLGKDATCSKVSAYRIDASAPEVKAVQGAKLETTAQGKLLSYALPPWTASLLVCE